MNRRNFFIASAALSAAGSMPPIFAATAVGSESLSIPWPIRGSETFAFHSKAVGDSLAVGVWQPAREILQQFGLADKPQDVVYVLDGSFALGMASAIAYLQLVDLVKPGFPPLLLVGVDYLEGKPNARTRDYTHTDLATALMEGELPPEQTIGGADNFLKFVEDELDPMIRSRYNVSDKPAGILGDSYGGTFTFHAFRRQSKLFDKYWLGSPGLFTTGVDYIGEVRKLLAGKLVHDTKMYLSFGALEANGGVPFYEDMGRNYNSLVSVLSTAKNPQLDFASKTYPDHTHTTIVAPALNDALLYLYGPHLPRG